jgi:hypothetical protein
MKLKLSRPNLEKFSNMKYRKNYSSGSGFAPGEQRERERERQPDVKTHMMTLTVPFHN